MAKIGLLTPEEAGKRAEAKVAKWKVGQKRAALGGTAAASKKPGAAEKPVVAPAAGKVLTPEERRALQRNLVDAAGNGDKAEVKRLLRAGADVNAMDNDGWTVLMDAAASGYVEVVGLLLEKGADANAMNGGGGSALISAINKEYILTVKLLLEMGANPNVEYLGQTALQHARNEEIKYLLKKYGARE